MNALAAILIAIGAFPGEDLYLAAHESETKGRFADAAKAYESVSTLDSPLAHHAAVRAGVCRARAGDTQGGIARLESFMTSAPAGPWKKACQAELALLYQRENRHAEAASLLGDVLDTPVSPRWLTRYQWHYAENLIALPDKRAQGYVLFAELLRTARTRDSRLNAARKLAGSPEVQHRMDAATAMVNAGEFGEAAPVLLSLGPMSPELAKTYAAQIAYLQARILLGTSKEKEQARYTLTQVAVLHPGTQWAAVALSQAARSYIASGVEPKPRPKNEPSSEAERRKVYREAGDALLERLCTEFADNEATGDLLWWLAHQHLDRREEPGEELAAIGLLVRLAEVCPSHERADDALYKAASLHHEKGAQRDAFSAFGRLLDLFPDSSFASAAAYRRACLRLAGKDTSGAVADFRRALNAGGIGDFYAHRALQRLEELGESPAGLSLADDDRYHFASLVRPIPVNGHSPQLYVPFASEEWHARLTFFADHGLEEAEWEAIDLAGPLTDPAKAGPLFMALADAGLAATAGQIMSATQWGMERGKPTADGLRVLYPRAYWNKVGALANETGADPYMLLAIARQESVFQARIVSSAGATGVMQLMPSTATWLAKIEPAIDPGAAALLTRPENSIRLGAYYFHRLWSQWDGNPVLAVASYNAGPGNVSKWVKRTPASDPDRFIEVIPFDETRDFVKKVLANYAAYHSVYADYDRLASATYAEYGVDGAE